MFYIKLKYIEGDINLEALLNPEGYQNHHLCSLIELLFPCW